MVNYTNTDAKYGLPSGTMASLVRQESGGNPNARSPVGAFGLVQFMPATRREMLEKTGLDAYNPADAVEVGAIYLSQLVKRFDGDVAKGLAAYNCGGGNVSKAIRRAAATGKDWASFLPAETRNYFPAIMRNAGIRSDELDNTWRYENASTHTADEMAEQERLRRSLLKRLGMTDEEISKFEPKDILSTMFFAVLIKLFTEKSVAMEVKAAPARTLETPSYPTDILPGRSGVTTPLIPVTQRYPTAPSGNEFKPAPATPAQVAAVGHLPLKTPIAVG